MNAVPEVPDYSAARLERLVLEMERAMDADLFEDAPAAFPEGDAFDEAIRSASGPAAAAAGDGPPPPAPPPDGAHPNAPHPSEATGGGGPDPDQEPDYDLTELGNSERLVDAFAGALRYVHAWKGWIAWDGRRWRRDARGADQEAAKTVVRHLKEIADAAQGRAHRLTVEHADIVAQASSNDRSKEAKQAREQARQSDEFAQVKRAAHDAAALRAWATHSSTARVISSMVKLACSEPRLVATPDELDADTWVLNVQNGTLDLRTGELRPHRQADMITKMAGAAYDPDARAPRWEQFLVEVLPDPEIRAWLQRFIGYCLTGETSEQIMAFALGIGNNGKNVLIETIMAILAEYATTAAPDLLVLKHGDEHPTGFADLHGHRFVLVSEIDHNRKWAEGTVKRLTGDRRAKARKMRQDFYEFVITFKFLVAANGKPEVRGTDDGIWRRILLVMFDVSITNPDKHLQAKLLEERDGILAWAVRGCLAWQRDGLRIPKGIADAVQGYKAEQDVVGQWLAERCVCVCLPNAIKWTDAGICNTCGASVPDPPVRLVPVNAPREPRSALYPDFQAWMMARGERPWTWRTLRAELLKRKGLKARPYHTNAERGIEGIQLRFHAPEGWPKPPDRDRYDQER